MDFLSAAKEFVWNYFPQCEFALVAGSVVRGEATLTSDLDIFIITSEIKKEYRESFFEYGWPIEAFIHTKETYKKYFLSDIERRRPSLPKMCAEGIIIIDNEGIGKKIKQEVETLLEKGPHPFSIEELETQRYIITDLLDDLIGERDYVRAMFIIHELSQVICNFILVNRGSWIGRGKWIPKLIRNLDEQLYLELTNSLNDFYHKKEKQSFIDFVEKELNKYGGRLFAGYSLGKC